MRDTRGKNTHIHTYIHKYIYTYIYICIHTYIHTYIYTAYIHIYTHMHTYTDTYIHTYMRACMHACMHTYMHACIHTCMHTYTYIHTFSVIIFSSFHTQPIIPYTAMARLSLHPLCYGQAVSTPSMLWPGCLYTLSAVRVEKGMGILHHKLKNSFCRHSSVLSCPHLPRRADGLPSHGAGRASTHDSPVLRLAITRVNWH